MSADAVRRTGIGIEKAGATTKPDEVVEIAASIIYRCDSGARHENVVASEPKHAEEQGRRKLRNR